MFWFWIGLALLLGVVIGIAGTIVWLFPERDRQTWTELQRFLEDR